MTGRLKSAGPDLFVGAALLVLVFWFFWPETEPAHSRYVYLADSFERAASYVTPDYGNYYHRHDWEDWSPLLTLLARQALLACRENIDLAIILLHLGLAVIACVLTYAANRLFLPIGPSAYVTVLLMFGRCLLPVTRGLGLLTVPLLPPLLLLMLFGLARSQSSVVFRRQRLIGMMLVGLSGGVIYSLGGHETLYAVVYGLVFAGVHGLLWILARVRQVRPAAGPSGMTLLGIAGAGVVGASIITLAWIGIPASQEPSSMAGLLTHRGFREMAGDVLRKEADLPPEHKSRYTRWQATFYWGKYSTHYGYHHSAFLYPGPGFNGMIPLFVYPAFLVGLVPFVRRVRATYGARDPTPDVLQERYFLVLNAIMLGMFAFLALFSHDPKPTRYTPCIYPVYAISAMGIHQLYRWVVAFVQTRRQWRGEDIAGYRGLVGSLSGIAVVVAFGLLLTLRVHKNYNDLQAYFDRYYLEIPSNCLPPRELLDQAGTEFASRPVWFLRSGLHVEYGRLLFHPAIGVAMGFDYRVPENVSFITELTDDVEVPPDAVVYVREGYNWRQCHADDLR